MKVTLEVLVQPSSFVAAADQARSVQVLVATEPVVAELIRNSGVSEVAVLVTRVTPAALTVTPPQLPEPSPFMTSFEPSEDWMMAGLAETARKPFVVGGGLTELLVASGITTLVMTAVV